MGGGFGSKLQLGAEGLICARLAQAGERAGQADARSQGRASGDRQPSVGGGADQGRRLGRRHDHRVRRPSRGAPAAPAPPRASRCRTSTRSRTAAGRTRTSSSTPASSGRCARRAIRRARFITEIMMDELADRVKMDPVEFRIKNLPPEAPNAMWRAYLREGAAAFGWDKRHPTGDTTPGPIKTGMGVAIGTWGGGGRGPAQAHCEIASDGSVIMRVGTQDLGTGTRTLVAIVDGRDARPAGQRGHAGDRRHDVSASAAARAAARPPRSDQPGDPHRRGQGARRAEGEGRAGARRRRPTSLVADGRPHPRQGQRRRRACRGRTPASRSAPQPISADGDWQPGLSSVTHQRRAVRRGARSTSRPASSR